MTKELKKQLSEAKSEAEIVEILKNNKAELTEDDLNAICGGFYTNEYDFKKAKLIKLMKENLSNPIVKRVWDSFQKQEE